MSRIRTNAKDSKGNSAILEFHYRNGNIWVDSENFVLKEMPETPLIVHRFPVCSHRHGGGGSVVGKQKHCHLGYMRDRRLSVLRAFRRLVQSRLDDNKFLVKLRDHCVAAAYREAVDRVRDLECQLVSAKSHRNEVLKEMVANKKQTKADPIALPLIP